MAAPFVPPGESQGLFKDIPYYLPSVSGMAIIGLGALFYVWCAIMQPWLHRCELVKEAIVDSDGISRDVYTRRPLNGSPT